MRMKKCMIADYIPNGQAYGVRKGLCHPTTKRWQHSHEFLEIVYTVYGSGVHCVDGKEYRVKRGTVLFIGRDQAHSYQSSEDMAYINIYVNPAAIFKDLSDISSVYELLFYLFPDLCISEDKMIPALELDSAFLSEAASSAEGVYREIRNKRCGYEFATDGYMRIFYTAIIRSLTSASSRRRSILSSEILDYVETNFTKRLTLTDLAERFFYSPVYLGRLFKKIYGISFKSYVLEKRLTFVTALLADTDMTVESVAKAAGFSDKKFFYRLFEEKYGCTPLEYRLKEIF